MKASIIIPTYNKRERLEITLKGLEIQSLLLKDYEVIAVNDGSSDGTKEYLESYGGPLNLTVIHQKNSGQAKARNKAVECSKGDILIFIDDDVFCNSRFLEKHLYHHCSKDRPCAVIGKIYYIHPLSFKDALRTLEKNQYKKEDCLREFLVEERYMDMRKLIWQNNYDYVKWICFTGANASVSREVFERAGGFDENFFGWGPEDAELGYRIDKCKVPFIYDKEIINYHLDKTKPEKELYTVLANNLKYMRDIKYKNVKEINKYISFGSKGVSLEELNHICSGDPSAFNKELFGELYYFTPLNYFYNKTN